jgi:dihydrofolate reductase
MTRSLLVALTPQGVIGRANALPWRLSADLKRFRQLTMGHCLLMGSRTFTSIGRPLPGRTTIVISRQQALSLPSGVLQAHSLHEAWQLAGADTEPFIVGGGEIYRLALPEVERVYATWVQTELPGDTYFPPFPTPAWREVQSYSLPADAQNEFATRYCVYERCEATSS